VPPLLPSLASLFIYTFMRDGPAFFAMCLFCCYCLLCSFFSFFLGLRAVCPRDYADLAQDCLWEYQVPLSSPCGLHLPKQSGCWHLVVAWGCYAWAGCVEESEFCHFSVVFPVMCISSISPRFYFRKHTFCFLPLATILEFSGFYLLGFCIAPVICHLRRVFLFLHGGTNSLRQLPSMSVRNDTLGQH
jgi:hypothetical protein